MNFIDLVKKRQSTRKFSSKPISRQIIDQCLEAARLAPSACNSQPWSFIVIDDEKTKNQIVDKALSGIYASNSFVKNAPAIVVIISEKSTYIARLGGLLRHVKYNLIDIGIAGDHLTLQAAELGLGTCWLGWFNEKAVKKILSLPSSAKIDIMIALGYPEQENDKEKNRKSLDQIRKYI